MNKILTYVRGPTLSNSGYGFHCREVVDFLLQDGRFEVFLDACNWGHTPNIHEHPRLLEYHNLIAKYQANQNIEFDLCIHVSIPSEFSRKGKVCIGITAGAEVDRISKEWIVKLNEMDMNIVPSTFIQNVITGTEYSWRNAQTGESGVLRVQKPVHVIPEFFNDIKTEDFFPISLKTKVNFLHVGQWGTKGGFGEDRKNIANLVRYFYEIFKDDAGVGLVLKINMVSNNEGDFEETKRRLADIKSNFKNPKCSLYLIHDTISDAEMVSLYRHPNISAFISLTHGEGFGRPLLEASAAGLPVIAPAWSGHVDFLREKKGFIPVDFSLVELPEAAVWPTVLEKGSKWAEVDREDLGKKLRRFVSSPTLMKKLAKENVSWVEENFSKQAVFKKWKAFFDELIVTDNPNAPPEERRKHPLVEQFESLVSPSENKKVLFVMPQSAGDVLICTALVRSLIEYRHSNDDFYFATNLQFAPLLEAIKELYPNNFKVIPFVEQMVTNADQVVEVWDYVYSPGVNVQYTFSNWLLGNGEYSVRLLEEFAKNCNLHPSQISNYVPPVKDCKIPENVYCTFGPGGIKNAKTYRYWEDVIANLKQLIPGLTVAQVGLRDEKLYLGAEDFRGLSYPESLNLIGKAKFHIGADSFPAHAAAAMDTPHVIVYGSTSPTTVTPVLLGENKLQILIDAGDEIRAEHGCKNPCYKNECRKPLEGRNCISSISPEAVCNAVKFLVEKMNEQEINP